MRLPYRLRLAARFGRSRAYARSAGIVLFSGLVLLAMYVTLDTLSLSGSQVVERDLGRFGASVGYGTVVAPPGDAEVASELVAAARRAGGTDAMALLSAVDVQLAGADGPREITLQEADWASHPFPGRYVLESGRWPERAGEIAVADPEDIGLAPGTEELAAFGGGGRFRVVGTANDRYARTASMLAAPGTWAGLDPGLAEKFPLLQAQPVLFWSGSAASQVVAAFAAVASRREDSDASPDAVAASLSTRGAVAARPERS